MKIKDDNLKDTVAERSEKISNLEQELNFPKTFCVYNCKSEMSLRKHMNTKHQLDFAEVHMAVKNNYNEQELKEARFLTQELEDKA